MRMLSLWNPWAEAMPRHIKSPILIEQQTPLERALGNWTVELGDRSVLDQISKQTGWEV
jgi:hypothetical protein